MNACDNDGWTALMYACGKGFKDIVQMLIIRGASIAKYDIYDRSPLDIAELYGHKEIMDLLLLYGAVTKRKTPYVTSYQMNQYRHENRDDSQMKHMKNNFFFSN